MVKYDHLQYASFEKGSNSLGLNSDLEELLVLDKFLELHPNEHQKEFCHSRNNQHHVLITVL